MHRQNDEKSTWCLLPTIVGDWLSHSTATLFVKSCWISVGKNTNYFTCSWTSNSRTISKTDFITQPMQRDQFPVFLLCKNGSCAIYQLKAVQRCPDPRQTLIKLSSLEYHNVVLVLLLVPKSPFQSQGKSQTA